MDKRYKLANVPIEDSDQPVHLLSLIRVFNGQSIGSQASNVSSSGVKLRLRPDCVYAHVRGSRKLIRVGPNLITFFFFIFLVDEGIEDQNTYINGSS